MSPTPMVEVNREGSVLLDPGCVDIPGNVLEWKPLKKLETIPSRFHVLN